MNHQTELFLAKLLIISTEEQIISGVRRQYSGLLILRIFKKYVKCEYVTIKALWGKTMKVNVKSGEGCNSQGFQPHKLVKEVCRKFIAAIAVKITQTLKEYYYTIYNEKGRRNTGSNANHVEKRNKRNIYTQRSCTILQQECKTIQFQKTNKSDIENTKRVCHSTQ